MDIELLVANVKSKIVYFTEFIKNQSKSSEFLEGQLEAYKNMLKMIESNIQDYNQE